MGDLSLDVGHLHNGACKARLTVKGLVALAERHFLDVTLEAIADKSKADILTKSLIVLQVSWMIVRCIARKINGYPLSLLEIHITVQCSMLW